MTVQVPVRVRFGMLLILAFAAVSDIRWLRTAAAARKWTYGQDEVSLNDERLRPLRAALSPHTTVGYVTSPPPEPPCSAEAALYQTLEYRRKVFKRYVLTQYALAPVIVVDNTLRDSIVGSFAAGDSPHAQLPPGMTLVRDFGGGIVLLSRVAR